MADKYGSLAFPLPVPGATETPADHALDVLLAYLKAFLNYYGGAAWRAIYFAGETGQTLAPVMKTFAHDPTYDDFTEKHLPALFLFRNGGARSEDIAEDVRATTTTLTLWWVFPADRDQKRRVRQRAFLNGVAKLIDQALRKERDPVYVVTGDTEPTATTEGSVVLVQAGIQSLTVSAPRIGEARIAKGDDVGFYPRIEMQLDAEEWRSIDIALFAANTQLAVDFTLSDETVTEQALYQ